MQRGIFGNMADFRFIFCGRSLESWCVLISFYSEEHTAYIFQWDNAIVQKIHRTSSFFYDAESIFQSSKRLSFRHISSTLNLRQMKVGTKGTAYFQLTNGYLWWKTQTGMYNLSLLISLTYAVAVTALL